jgi:hypothetical protein
MVHHRLLSYGFVVGLLVAIWVVLAYLTPQIPGVTPGSKRPARRTGEIPVQPWGSRVLEQAPGVTRANFLRLYKGMSEREALSILGKPDGQFHQTGGRLLVFFGKDGAAALEISCLNGPGEVEGGDFEQNGRIIIELQDKK